MINIRGRPHSGGRWDLYSANIFRKRGVFQMRTPSLFDAKNFGFFEIYGVSARTRGEGLSQGGHFSDKGGGGQFFCNFVRTSFMDNP